MCGMFGFITESPEKSNRIRCDFVSQMLYVDALRGQDATGIFSVKASDKNAYYLKDAIDARLFLQQDQFTDAIDDFRVNRYVAVGHNRKATLGLRDFENAHPFITKTICMVHNGTLRGYHQLPHHATGNSDSSYVCAALADCAPGGLSVLTKLDGDYAFIWYDKRVSKMYFATNGRRPLDYLRCGDHTFFASEGMMAKFVLSRLLEGKLPRISHFKPFHLYSVAMGEVVFQMEKYEKEHVTYYPPRQRQHTYTSPAGSHVHLADAMKQRNPANDINHNPGIKTQHNIKSGGVIPGKELVTSLKLPSESKKACKRRLTKTNQLLRSSDVDLKVGDVLEINRETARSYETKENQAKGGDCLGELRGFMSWVLEGDEAIFHAQVVNCLMVDVFSDMVDTVKAVLFGAYIDEQGDMCLLLDYREVAAYRRPVATDVDEKEWPAYIRHFFENHRHFYNESDMPEHEWFESTCLLTNREMDLLLNEEACGVCGVVSALIPYDNMVFVGEQTIVCAECNKKIDDENAEGKTITVSLYNKDGKITGQEKKTLELPFSDDDKHNEATAKMAGMVWDPKTHTYNRLGKTLPTESTASTVPTAQKRRLTIDNATGTVVDKETGEVFPLKTKAAKTFTGQQSGGTAGSSGGVTKPTAKILTLPGTKLH
jgi:hypothetical protein